MTRKEYLKQALYALECESNEQAAKALLERPGTLRDALRALLYRVDYAALRESDMEINIVRAARRHAHEAV